MGEGGNEGLGERRKQGLGEGGQSRPGNWERAKVCRCIPRHLTPL